MYVAAVTCITLIVMLRNVDGVFVMYICTYYIATYGRGRFLGGCVSKFFFCSLFFAKWVVKIELLAKNNRSSHWPGSAPRLAQTPCNWPGGWVLMTDLAARRGGQSSKIGLST